MQLQWGLVVLKKKKKTRNQAMAECLEQNAFEYLI